MKFGLRMPSLTRRISARTSWKRYVRHSLGLKAPRGMGILTNPKKAIYNKVYNKTSFGVDHLIRSSKNSGSKNNYSGGGDNGNFAIGCFVVVLIIAFIINPIVGAVLGGIRGIYLYIKFNSPIHKLNQKIKKAEGLLQSNNYQDIIDLLKNQYNDGKNTEIAFLLGISYYGLEDYDKAIDPLEQAYQKTSTNYNIGLRLANCYYEIGKYDETIKILQNIPESFEKYIKVIQLQGASFHKKGQTDIAIDVFKKAPLLKRRLDDDLLETHYNLAILYKENNDIKNAIKHFKKVYAFDINYRDVKALLEGLETK